MNLRLYSAKGAFRVYTVYSVYLCVEKLNICIYNTVKCVKK